MVLDTLTEDQEGKLRNAGARVECQPIGAATTISWPGQTLRDFMLFEVLMHEIRHHVIQQYKGKRTVRVVRTRDHEAAADRFAARCRAEYYAGSDPDG